MNEQAESVTVVASAGAVAAAAAAAAVARPKQMRRPVKLISARQRKVLNLLWQHPSAAAAAAVVVAAAVAAVDVVAVHSLASRRQAGWRLASAAKQESRLAEVLVGWLLLATAVALVVATPHR
jgi:hypothetical protein